ncbi:MBL fold metallo-hydrolase [Candidatus Rariloculus sp.]|uniref:MBL fold metallo-hydrolase n=1 Tax=Candidatus Rariloculus sp. TaxID=3101265 RepID=UPI003D0A8D3A
MYVLRHSYLPLALLLAASAAAQPNFEEQIAVTEVTSQQLGEGLHVLFGVGGAIAASIGDQGVLIVDDQFPGMVPKIRAKVRELGGGDIDFAINTHFHFDHADGNLVLGPEGTWLVSQENSREKLTGDNVINLVNQTIDQPAYPDDALPSITFERHMRFHFNGEPIDLLHFGPAHTEGDAAVVFRGHNAVHMGDVFNNAGYPFIDADNGGSLAGIIAFCQGVLEEIDANTVVVPGHGAIADSAALEDYVSMLSTIHDRIAALITSGASLEQVVAARPTAEWDEERGDPASFLNRSYTSMTR